jgi:hypothetical protein
VSPSGTFHPCVAAARWKPCSASVGEYGLKGNYERRFVSEAGSGLQLPLRRESRWPRVQIRDRELDLKEDGRDAIAGEPAVSGQEVHAQLLLVSGLGSRNRRWTNGAASGNVTTATLTDSFSTETVAGYKGQTWKNGRKRGLMIRKNGGE